ncbi:uncharacterized protein LOC126970636 isoform X2 [Leptidea sinapis]|uniref:uncharacterized protein LOC126970636 isoform X2 n=1 Tax=Leptidea sinapis TaxID=189913 RepID=UPI0021C3460F|nr:uncharacterized protein LOC126970636 isoform X2 [Leptidea sinapis]
MTARGGGKKELDPEELMKRKFRAKCLFRALGRLVMANAHWMIEAVDHYEGLDNVKRRVEQAVRGKARKKQLLGVQDKALLNKKAEERTDQEKKYIFRIIGGLKCFKRYPNNVKKKLAAVTYFKYYGPGRVIVRQHQEAHALYFVVTGEVVVSQMIYDELLQQYVSVDIGTMHSGDMFGEVSLLHNIPRTATCTTAGHCELLVLMKEDFKNVLQASVQKQWDEVKRAMSAFTYFDALDEVARREGCIVAKMKSYLPNETLLGDGVGVHNFVYFILSGRCQMIESLQVIVSTRLGHKYYSLYDPYVPKEESEQDFDTKYFGAYKDLIKDSKSSQVRDSMDSSAVKAESSKRDSSRGGSILKSSVQRNMSVDSKCTNVTIVTKEDGRPSKESGRGDVFEGGIELLEPTGAPELRTSVRLSLLAETTKPPRNIKTYFMQVCQFNPGSSFGFGENMRDRRIVALTHVDCMLLPMIWLLQRNTANIWTRIQHYLEKKVELLYQRRSSCSKSLYRRDAGRSFVKN